MPIGEMSYLFILKAVYKRADKKIVAQSAADSYQKRDITLALSGNARRLIHLSIDKSCIRLYYKYIFLLFQIRYHTFTILSHYLYLTHRTADPGLTNESSSESHICTVKFL